MPQLKLTALLGLNKTGFDAGMKAAEHQVAHFGKHLLGHLTALASAGAFVQFVESVIEMGTQLKHLSLRLGTSVEDLQQFDLAAKLAGLEGDQVAKAFEKIRVAMVEAVGSGKNPLEIFGITIDELKKGDAAGVLRKLAQELEHFAGSADQTKALVDVFGAKGAGNILLMLRELNHAHAAGLSDQEVDALAESHKAQVKFGQWMRVKMAEIIATFAYGGLPYSYPGAKKKEPEAFPQVEALEAQQELHMKLGKLQERIDDQNEKNRMAQMTDEEKLNALMEKRVELQKNFDAAKGERRAELALALAQNEGEIIAARAKIVPPQLIAKTGMIAPGNPLGAIGAFTGGPNQALHAIGESTLILKRIESALVNKGIIIRDVAR